MIASLLLIPLLACDPKEPADEDSETSETTDSDGTGPTDGLDTDPTTTGPGGDDTDTDTMTDETTGGTLVGDCEAGGWAPGAQAFRDASTDWGLPDFGAAGVRVDAVDFDGDGWTDLAVRSGNSRDDFAAGTRSAWLLRNTGAGGFEDVTQSSGVRAMRGDKDPNIGRPGATWVFGDVNNDGHLDVYTGLSDADSADPTESSEIMLGDGAGGFVLAEAPSDFQTNAVDQPYGAAFVDMDRDGFLDLWVTNYFALSDYRQDRLYRGDGTGGFTDVTSASGVNTKAWSYVDEINEGLAHSVAWAAGACDLNNDGWPELLASSYGRAPNHLWRNEGGVFANASVASGYAYDHREDWSDNESARCWCTLHPTDVYCDGVPEPELIACDDDGDVFRWNHTYDWYPFRLGGNSGATVCADVDNDGWMDLLTTEIVHWDVGGSSDPSELMFNTGDPSVVFERPGNEITGLTRDYDRVDWNDGDITASVFDFDNDGWPDVYIGSTDYPGTRGLLYHQSSPRDFEPVDLADGVDHLRSHGSAIADFDRDGDLDMVVGHSSARCHGECYDTFDVRLFENLTGNGGDFVQLRLQGGEGSNRAAVGARVDVLAGGVVQTQEVDGGHGQWGNQDDLVLHFGVGPACVAEVTVRWPDAAGTTETFTVDRGSRYLVIQGEAPVVETPGGSK